MLKQILSYISSRVIRAIGKLLYACRIIFTKTITVDIHHKAEMRNAQNNYIFCVWHSNFSTLLFFRSKYNIVKPPETALIFDCFRGRVIGVILEEMGVNVIFSNTTNHFSITRELCRRLRAGESIYFIVDGPKGPYKVINKNLYDIARITRTPIIAISFNYTALFRLFWRWDKLQIPLPFSHIRVMYSQEFNKDFDEKKLYDELGN